jgi:serine/threonine protein kinase
MQSIKSPHVLVLVGTYSLQWEFYMLLHPFADMTLSDFLSSPKPKFVDDTSKNWILNTIVCLSIGLSHLHEAGVVHRDIKGNNILLKGGHVFISDFGLGYQADNPSQHMPSKVGNPKYLAIEAEDNKKYPRKADVYSIGAIMSELLAFGFNINPETYDRFRAENGPRKCFQSNHKCFAHNQDVVEGLLHEFARRCPELRKLIAIVRDGMLHSRFIFRLSASDAASQLCAAVAKIDGFRKHRCCANVEKSNYRDISMNSLMEKFNNTKTEENRMEIDGRDSDEFMDIDGIEYLMTSGPFGRCVF